MKPVKTIIRTAAMASVVLLGACSYLRYESVDTCEFEQRDLFAVTLWLSANCLGNKEAASHVEQSVRSTRELTKGKNNDETGQDTKED